MAGRYDDAREPKHHPSDVRSYIAWGALAFIGLVLLIEVSSVVHAGCNVQATLDAWALFDVALFTIASAIITFYFISSD